MEFQELGCNEFAKNNPEASKYMRICTPEQMCKNSEDLNLRMGEALGRCYLQAGVVLKDTAFMVYDIIKGVRGSRVERNNCLKDVNCRREVLSFHPVASEHWTNNEVMSIKGSTMIKLYKEMLEKTNPAYLKDSESSILNGVKEYFKDIGLKLDCYNTIHQMRLTCYGFYSIAMPGIGVDKLTKLAGMARVSRVLKSLKPLQQSKLKKIAKDLVIPDLKLRRIVQAAGGNLDKHILALEKIVQNKALTPAEALSISQLLSRSKAKGLITTHATRPEFLDSIITKGLTPSHKTKMIFAFGQPLNKTTVSRFLLGNKNVSDGALFFQGEASELFKLHKVTGLDSLAKRIAGVEVTKPGKVIIEEYKRVGNSVVVTKARLDPVPLSNMEKVAQGTWYITDAGKALLVPLIVYKQGQLFKNLKEERDK